MVKSGDRREAAVPRVVNGWFAANALWGLVGGGIGILVDVATGSVRKTPDAATVFIDFTQRKKTPPL